MLDTCICSFIMREQPASVIPRLPSEVEQGNHIVISAITYAEMRYGQIGMTAPTKQKTLVDEFVKRLDEVMPWDRAAVDATVEMKFALSNAGMPIGPNDTAVAGHAIAAGCKLVSNNVRECGRVLGLDYEDWVK